jgi:O-antigen/teichoic acid export membrane protein
MLSRWMVVLLYSEKFIEAVYPLQVLLIGNVFISGWRILANDIAARGKPMINTYTIGSSLLANILLNVFWIPRYGIAGAAYATSVSYFFLFLVTAVIYAKISGNEFKKVFVPERTDVAFYKQLLLSVKKIL